MNYKKSTAISLTLGILLLAWPISCGPSPEASGPNVAPVSEFEVIRQSADAYLSTGKADDTISGRDLEDILRDDNPANDPNILSVRLNKHFRLGHICGATNIPWRALFMDSWFSQLPPKDEPLLVYSYNGHNGGQVTAILNMLGWDAINLQWGFTCWMLCPFAAPGLYRPSPQGGIAMNYPVETTMNGSTDTYPFPVIENSNLGDENEITRAAADEWFRTEEPPPPDYLGTSVFYQDMDIKPKDLFSLLNDGNSSNDPFILSVREPEYFAKGHIPGAINIPLAELAKLENLSKLPTDRQIVVYSNDGMSGSQAAAILNALDYDVINLLFGMTGWTRDEDVAPDRFLENYPGTDKHFDILDLEICFGIESGSGTYE